MITFSIVIGKACVDPDARADLDVIRKQADTPGYITASRAMYDLTRKWKLRPSLFETWELVRVFSPNPKGWFNGAVDDRVDRWFARMKTANATVNLPNAGTQHLEVYEVMGVACVDSDFRGEAETAAGSTDTMDGFLAKYNFTITTASNQQAVEFLVAVFSSNAMLEGIKQFREPVFPKAFAEDTRCWDPPCEPNYVFNLDYNLKHPWGFPGRWKVPNQL